MKLPVFLHLVVHAYSGGLIDGDDHSFAHLSARHKVRYDVLGDLFKAFVASNQLIFAGKFMLESPLLALVEFYIFDELFHILVYVDVGKLQCRDAVLVVKGYSGTILDRLAEVGNNYVGT